MRPTLVDSVAVVVAVLCGCGETAPTPSGKLSPKDATVDDSDHDRVVDALGTRLRERNGTSADYLYSIEGAHDVYTVRLTAVVSYAASGEPARTIEFPQPIMITSEGVILDAAN